MSRRGEVSAGALGRGGSPTFLGVQALRGVAAGAVVLSHAGKLWGELLGVTVPAVLLNGASGVDIFFAISGFVMAISALGSRRPTPGDFLRRRVLRVVPLYWLITLLAVTKLLLVKAAPALGSTAEHAPLQAREVLASLLFVPYTNAVGLALPILQPGWTLEYEMFFYVLFALALLVRVRPLRVLLPGLLVLAAVGWARGDGAGWPVWTVLLNPLLLEFAGGVLLGMVARRAGTLQGWQAGIVAGLGLAGLAALSGLGWSHGVQDRVLSGRVLFWGVPAWLAVGSAVMLEERLRGHVPRWLLRVGDASYSLYLSHVLTVMFCAWMARRVFGIEASGTAGLWGFCALACSISVGVALGIYRWVERPMTAALARWTGWNRGRAPMVESAG